GCYVGQELLRLELIASLPLRSVSGPELPGKPNRIVWRAAVQVAGVVDAGRPVVLETVDTRIAIRDVIALGVRGLIDGPETYDAAVAIAQDLGVRRCAVRILP